MLGIGTVFAEKGFTHRWSGVRRSSKTKESSDYEVSNLRPSNQNLERPLTNTERSSSKTGGASSSDVSPAPKRRNSASSASMQRRESILSQFYSRGRKDAPVNARETVPASMTAVTSEAGLSPQVSANSVRSTKSNASGSLGAKPLMPQRSNPSAPPLPEEHEDTVAFKIQLETPPAIMYGTPQDSVGALISGICDVDLTKCYSSGSLNDDGVDLLDVSMSIVQVLKYSVPPQIAKRLAKGTEQRNVLATWDILKYPHILKHATFAYPFSHLLPGTLPPTSNTPLFSVDYYIEASATTKDNHQSKASLPLKIGRSVIGVTDKTSVRIFPPTSLSLSMLLPTALFPNSQVQAELRIEGMLSTTPPGSTLKYKRWLVKRINWRVDELIKVKYGDQPEDEYEFKHTLGFGAHKSGWKTDYSTKNGIVEFVCPEFCPGVLSKASKDMHDPVLGLSVTHQLICELLIAEEVVSKPTVKQGVLSGSARVLRMQFLLPVVDRPGLGISWEDEVPPMYADIPLSPPQYNEVADLPSLEEFHSNTLVFSPLLSPTMSPTLRHFDPNMRGFEHSPSPLISSTMSLHPTTSSGYHPGANTPSLTAVSSPLPPSLMPLQPARSAGALAPLSLSSQYPLHSHGSSSSSASSALGDEEPAPPAIAKHR